MGTVGGWRGDARVRSWSEFESTEAALRTARVVLEGAPVPMVAIDGRGELVFASPMWSELCGVAPAAMASARAWAATLFGDDADEVLATLAGGAPGVELPIKTASGDERTVVFASAVVDDRAAGVLTIVSATDVTERKRKEVELARADEQKNQFLAVLGHELRNPLAVVRTSISLLELVPSTSPMLAQAREILRRQTQHMARLLDGLLDISRIVRGKLALEREIVDLCEVVRDVMRDRASQMEARGIGSNTTLPDHPVWISGDSSRLVQVFDNLLSNAIKFTPRDGRIEVEMSADDERASVVVRDTGLGISEEFLEQVFEPFQQAPRSMSHTAGGLGLGLALVQKVVELHGGTVRVHSDGPDRGAEFRIELLRARAPETETPPPPPRGAPRRILLVEDNRDHAALLQELLRRLGHEVHTCFDAEEALGCANDFRPEVVLCDIGLPGDMDGYQLATELHRRDVTAGTALIALTGYAGAATLARAHAAGFAAQLTKPVDVEAIEAALAELSLPTEPA